MMQLTRQLFVSCIVMLCLSLTTFAWPKSDAAEVTASVAFSDGHIAEYTLPERDAVELDTCAGKLAFPNVSIASIYVSTTTDLITVYLTSGEQWRSIIKGDILDMLNVKDRKDITEQHGRVRQIKFLANNAPPSFSAHCMRLLLEDGSQTLINTSDLILSVENEYGTGDLPIGSLRALKFVAGSDNDTRGIVLARFASGRVKRLQLRSRRPYLKIQDFYGNSLKVHYKHIKGILRSSDLAETSVPSVGAKQQSDDCMIIWKDGHSEAIQIPLAIWKLKMQTGSVSLPSPLLSSIKPNEETSRSVVVQTIYGEILKGKLSERCLRILSENEDGYTDLDFDKIREVKFNTPSLTIPDGWLIWYLNSGDALVGRFADADSGLQTNEGEDLPSEAISSLSSTAENTFIATTGKGRVVKSCSPISKKTEILLLNNGMSLSLPWGEIQMLKFEQTITESCFKPALPIPERPLNMREENNSKADTDETPERVFRLSTAIGSIKLQQEIVANVEVSKRRTLACVTTVCGDRFLVSTPSRKWFEDLQNLEDYEWPDANGFIITLREIMASDGSSNYAICRLLTGDILHGTLPKQTLDIRHTSSASRAGAIQSPELKRIFRNVHGDLAFQRKSSSQITGTPKQKALEFAMFATGVTNMIPFKRIETLLIGERRLPPTTVFRPHLPSDLTGEVLLEGGTFRQGSENGITDEQPVHKASVGSFFMDTTEVTRAQFVAFVRDSGYETLAEKAKSKSTWHTPGFVQRADDPVVCISWIDAASYCNWRSEQTYLKPCYTFTANAFTETDRTASGYRLPSEAEWEFAACNRGEDHLYPWNAVHGRSNSQHANYHQQDTDANDGWEWTNPVKTFPANALGIYGLGGNVWEWCEDWYFDRAYTALLNRNIPNPCFGFNDAANMTRRVMRGGSFRNDLDLLRCASRGSGNPYAFSNHVGFRCVRNAE